MNNLEELKKSKGYNVEMLLFHAALFLPQSDQSLLDRKRFALKQAGTLKSAAGCNLAANAAKISSVFADLLKKQSQFVVSTKLVDFLSIQFFKIDTEISKRQ